MNRHVSAIASRLSLRPPQQQSLEILSRICEILPPKKGADLSAGLAAIQSEFPTVTNFEREFPSLCFSLATGVGKTRLMGAFVSYLYLAHSIKNFFVLAPNLPIYNKLITDFTPNTPKYVLKGIAEFAIEAPEIITGDNYENRGTLLNVLTRCKINVFNISKINSEVRGGRSPRIKKLEEYIGDSYFNYLAELDDLVILMDESHRYRASAGVRAINELKPVLGLELTATPFVETSRGAIPFKNVIYDYPLGRAMADGFVKKPAVVTRKDFNPAGMSAEQIEHLKLEDGVRLHESLKVELETYARETGNEIVKPFILVIARDTTHAAQLVELIQSVSFFNGRYETKVIQVDSSKTGAQEDEMVERLLKVEQNEEPTEIVVHALKPSAYTTAADEAPLDYRQSPTDKSNMAKYLFGGFAKCLYSVQKFQSDTERMLSVILEREAIKWFKPASSVPQACGDIAATSAADDFWNSPYFQPADIRNAHRKSTIERIKEHPVILAIQDTTNIDLTNHSATVGLGYLDHRKSSGLKVHSTLAATTDGFRLGIIDQQVWAREPENLGIAKKRRQRKTQEKESQRWLDGLLLTQTSIPKEVKVVTVGDSEADIFDLFSLERPENSQLLIRGTHNL